MKAILLGIGLMVSGVASAQPVPSPIFSSSKPPPPVFDLYPSLAPQAYCGTVKLRSAYAGPSLRLALGNSFSTVQDFGWVTAANGTKVADDASVQAWLALHGNTFAYVATCYDQSGNGNDYTAGTVGTDSPYYKGITANNIPSGSNPTPAQAEWLGLPSMNFYARNFSTTGVATLLNINASVTANYQSASFMISTSLNDTRPSGVVQQGAGLVILGSNAWSFGQYLGNAFTHSSTGTYTLALPVASDWSVKGFTASASQFCGYDDISSNCISNSFAAGALSGGTIGGSTGESYDGNTTAILGPWSTTLTSTQYGQVRDALKAQLGISATPQYEIVFDGDSITEAYYGTLTESHAMRAIEKVYNATGIRVRSYNVAVAGACLGYTSGSCATTTNLTSAFNAKTLPALQTGTFLKRILYIMGGTNDLGSGATAAATNGFLSTYITNARAVVPGVHIIYGGTLSQISVDATCYTYMQDVLASAAYDVLTGWYNDTNMRCQSGGGTNYSNTTYFDSDGVHPINLGHDVGAGYDATALESLLP